MFYVPTVSPQDVPKVSLVIASWTSTGGLSSWTLVDSTREYRDVPGRVIVTRPLRHRHLLVDSTHEYRDVPRRVRVTRPLRHRHPLVDSPREYRDVPGRFRVTRLLRHQRPLVDSTLLNATASSTPIVELNLTFETVTRALSSLQSSWNIFATPRK